MKKVIYLAIFVITILSASAFEWLHADQHDFEIITITDDNGANWDYVSNGESWLQCNPTVLNRGIAPPAGGEFGYEHKAKSSKFLCVKQDKNYVFLECCRKDLFDERKCNVNNPETKQVSPGGSSSIVVKDISETFDNPSDVLYINELNFHNWSGYNEMVVIYKVSDNHDITLEIFENNNPVFAADLNDYAINKENEYVQARISIPPSLNVSAINFRYTPKGIVSSNIFNLDRVYLLSSNVKFCSGARFSIDKISELWLADLDNSTLEFQQVGYESWPAGKFACNNVPSFKWTGTKCCGDDGRSESYNDESGGCAGGISVSSGQLFDRNMLFFEGQLFGCEWSSQIYPVQKTGRCTTKGGYYCSIEGWSNNVSNSVLASERNSTKVIQSGINILENPTFENDE